MVAKFVPAVIPNPTASAPCPNARAVIAAIVKAAPRIPWMIEPALAESYAVCAASRAAWFVSMDLLIC